MPMSVASKKGLMQPCDPTDSLPHSKSRGWSDLTITRRGTHGWIYQMTKTHTGDIRGPPRAQQGGKGETGVGRGPRAWRVVASFKWVVADVVVAARC